MMDRIHAYFDLVSDLRSVEARSLDVDRGMGRSADAGDFDAGPTPPSAGGGLPPVWPQYVALVLGVLIQPFFTAYQQTGAWQLDGFTGRILFALIAGVIIMPGVYRNAFDPQKPIAIQLGALFTAGMGWESLLATAVKAGMG